MRVSAGSTGEVEQGLKPVRSGHLCSDVLLGTKCGADIRPSAVLVVEDECAAPKALLFFGRKLREVPLAVAGNESKPVWSNHPGEFIHPQVVKLLGQMREDGEPVD